MASPPSTNGVNSPHSPSSDAILNRQVYQLLRLQMVWRWLWVGLIWLTIGAWSLWELRESIMLLHDYFSLTGVIYSLYFHLGAACGIVICLAFTCSSILWQISYIFWGLTDKERHQLAVKVNKIQTAGAKHPLWRWIQVKQ